ncbi:MAG: hypothetical protein USCAAHI_00988 [Beijerinckiaceae bacterium]|jgi:hypothetical protein|nr:MAG: hypothetical protein USCAAHI_00988 [Beijerinckiaceae bacterium]
MLGHQSALDSYLQNLIPTISREISVLSGIAAISVLIFYVFVSINHFRSKKISEKFLPAITDQSEGFGPERGEPNDPPGPVSMAFVKDLVATRNRKLCRSLPCKQFSPSLSTPALPKPKFQTA